MTTSMFFNKNLTSAFSPEMSSENTHTQRHTTGSASAGNLTNNHNSKLLLYEPLLH